MSTAVVGGHREGHYIVPGVTAPFEPNLIDYRHSVVQAGKRADAGDETLEICAWCHCEVDVDPQPHRPGCAGIGKPRVESASGSATARMLARAETARQRPPVRVGSARHTLPAADEHVLDVDLDVVDERYPDDWQVLGDGHPNAVMVKKRFGKWADAIVAAGFERPTRGRSHKGRRTSTELAPDIAVDVPVEPPVVAATGSEAGGLTGGAEAPPASDAAMHQLELAQPLGPPIVHADLHTGLIACLLRVHAETLYDIGRSSIHSDRLRDMRASLQAIADYLEAAR